MDCVNHSGVTATAYCQNCGKALCASCIRQGTAGQVYCEPCANAWRQAAPFPPSGYAVPPAGVPNPTVAAVLGIIPGVGAMYNGQFLKGFVHVAIFAVLASLADHNGPLGIFVFAWIIYQVFEAYHTAKARRDGLPLPDPLGLNEAIQNWSNQRQPPYNGQPGAGPAAASSAAGVAAGSPPTAGAHAYAPPYSYQPYSTPFSPPAPPPIPPVPPLHWRRREPVAAIVLIALGILFLLNQFDIFSGRLLHFSWPLLLICLGAWLIIRRVRDSKGGSL